MTLKPLIGLLSRAHPPKALSSALVPTATPRSKSIDVYLLLHLLEADFVTPILPGRKFSLNPVAIFVSLMLWMWLWGVPGVLLSVPILVSIKVVCDRVPSMSFVSEFLSE